MPIKRRNCQVLSYLKDDELLDLDTWKDELDVSRADLIRQCVLDGLERRRQSAERLASLGDFVTVERDDVVSLG